MAKFRNKAASKWIGYGLSKDEVKKSLTEYHVFEMSDKVWIVATDGHVACCMSEDDGGVDLSDAQKGQYVLNPTTNELVFHREPDDKSLRVSEFIKTVVGSGDPSWKVEYALRMFPLPNTRSRRNFVATFGMMDSAREAHWIGWNTSFEVKKMLNEKYDATLSFDCALLKPLQEMDLSTLWTPKQDKSEFVSRVTFMSANKERFLLIMPVMQIR